MTEDEFKTGVRADGTRLMQPINVEVDLLATIHGRGFIHLAQHFSKMKDTMASFIADHETPSDAREADFISAMIEALDGPEQRAIEAELTKPFDYIAEARLTLSPSWHGDKVAKFAFVERMNAAIRAANALDQVKKTLFYGKDNGIGPNTPAGVSVSKLPLMFGDTEPEVATNLIHAIIGKFTEAGELLEALRDAIDLGKPLDNVNILEEIGDGFWYDAILLYEIGGTFDGAQRVNIDKLRKRFPDRFTEYDANNRNLVAERAILEGRPGGHHVGNIGDSDGDDGA